MELGMWKGGSGYRHGMWVMPESLVTQPTPQPGLACLTTAGREVRGRDRRKEGEKEGGREGQSGRIHTDTLLRGKEKMGQAEQWVN